MCCASISNAQDLNDKRALAKSAHQLSKAAVERQEWTTAKVLLMNAFNRHPEKISYLSALYEFNRQYEPQDPQAMNELIELMERAQYLIAPQHIHIVQQYIAALRKKNEQFQQTELNTPNLDHQVKLLTQIQLLSSSSVKLQINETLGQLNDLLSLYSDSLNDQQKRSLHLQQNRLSRYSRLLNLSEELKRYVNLLKKTTLHESPRAKARILMISNTLNIMYGEDIEALPKGVKELVDHELNSAEAELQSYRKQIAEKHHQRAIKIYNHFIKQYNQAVDHHQGFQEVFKEGSKTVDALRGLQLKMQVPSLQVKVSELTRQTQDYVNYALEAQRIMYNRWAAKLCLTARTLLDEEVSLSDDEAVSIFEESSLAQINVRYISPEVSSIYHQLIQEILAELPAKKAILIQRKLMLSEKRKLATF